MMEVFASVLIFGQKILRHHQLHYNAFIMNKLVGFANQLIIKGGVRGEPLVPSKNDLHSTEHHGRTNTTNTTHNES